MTYPDPALAAAVTEHCVPCKLESGSNVPLMKELGVRWLPGIVVADAAGRVQHQWIGFLPPALYADELLFARGMAAYSAKQLDQAERRFDELVAGSPASERAPEALYWQGVTRYRQGGGLDAAATSWARIVRDYPDSLWARKTEIFL